VFLSEGQACLIDPGYFPFEIEAIARFVAEQGAAPQAIILTHSHYDHVLGPAHFPGVQIVAQANYVAAVRQYGDGIQRSAVAHAKIERPFVIPQPDLTYEETMTLPVGDVTLHLAHTPGHAPDLSVVYHPESATLWAADMLSDFGVPSVIDDLSAYQRTLATIAPWEIRVLVPGHGQPTTDRGQIRTIFSQNIAYLAELRERVSQAIAQGKTAEETIASCADMRLWGEDWVNNWAHPLNVGQVYLLLGGDADPAQVGWSRALDGVF
jgi:glyoxylase-like metal-dependent hydrolase (beta-lactamase superfamily II)